MKLLPKEDRTIHMEGDCVIVGAHEYPANTVFYTKYALSDLPNNFVSLDDLKRLGIVSRVDA